MAETRNGGAPARIEVFVAVFVIDKHAVAPGNDREGRFRKPVKDVFHVRCPLARG
jgi:hypothetical protein